MVASVFTVVELTGHIIDSLTLAKVIDRIQAAGVEYQINDIRVGKHKHDTSTAQISLWTTQHSDMDVLLEALLPYGVLPVDDHPVHLTPCQVDGLLPPDAFVRHNPPCEIRLEDSWIPVEQDGSDLTIIFDLEKHRARLVQISALKAGDMVVTGHAGVRLLPLLEQDSPYAL